MKKLSQFSILLLAGLLIIQTAAATELPDVHVLRRHEIPGVLRVGIVFPYSSAPDTVEAVFGVSAVEPVVRKSGEFHTVTIALPPGQAPAVLVSAVDPAGEVVGVRIEADAFSMRVRTLHRPTVSKRGDAWFFLVTYFLQ